MNLDVIKYLADEVERQQDHPSFVYGMAQAWYHLKSLNSDSLTVLSEHDIMEVARYIKHLDVARYRTTPVRFASGGHAVNASCVPRSMEMLIRHRAEYGPDDFCFEFLKIHPFADGNGRTASLIRNYICGTLDQPTPLPYYKFA